MGGDQAGEVEADDGAVDDPPLAGDQHPVRAVGAAEQQGGQRVVAAGETKIIQGEQSQVCLLADGDGPDVVAPEHPGGSRGGPAEGPLGA